MSYVLLVWLAAALFLAGAAWAIARAAISPRKKLVLAAAAAASIAIKIILAAQGHNYDMVSYGIVAALVESGQNVYAHTARYNYAPLWACLLAGLKRIADWAALAGPERFHVVVAAFLAIGDVTTAAILAAAYSFGAGLFFLGVPVVLLLTGYHSQFEGLALLFALSSWVVLRRGAAGWGRLALAALLAGLSLATKHILFLFPLWVLMWPGLGRMRRRVAYAAIAYGVWAASFLPWATEPAARAGIVRNVFRYRSDFNLSAAHLVMPAHLTGQMPPLERPFLWIIWVTGIVAAGVVVARNKKQELLPMYLLAMFSASPALVDQYLAIPMLACAILPARWPSAALAVTATVALLVSPGNILRPPMTPVYFACMPATQVCAAALFFIAMRERAPAQPSSHTFARAAGKIVALVLGAVAFAWFRLFLLP